MSDQIHRCGDSGGITRTGSLCRFRVATKGDRCPQHPREWDPAVPAEIRDEVGEPQNWDKAVNCAYLRLIGSSVAEAADGAGVGERTLTRWEGCSWWGDALREAEDRWLGHLVARSQRTVFRAAGEDPNIAMKILERRMDKLAPPKVRGETTNLDVDLSQLDEHELQELANGTDLFTIIARRAARMREESEA